MSNAPRLLLITYEFPPKGGPGVQRPLKTAKYLSRLGWDVTVLTVANPLGGMMDESLLAQLPAEVRVERAWSLEPTRLVALARRLGGRGRRGGTGAPYSGGARGYTSLPRWFIRLVQAFFIPDEKAGWTPWAVKAARRVHAKSPVDVVLASGPPFTAYRVAWRVARELRVPWVADLRDPIVGGYFFTPLTPVHALLMRRFETRVARSAAYIVTASEGFTAEFRDRHREVAGRIETITNGFDPDDFDGVVRKPSGGFVVAHIGTFQAAVSSDTLLDALVLLRERASPVMEDVRVRFVGALDAETGEAIERRGLGDVVKRVGYLPHAEAIAEMCSADVLLALLGAGPEMSAVVPGKLLEYLAAGRAVLAVAPEGVAVDVARRAGVGDVVHPGDVEGAAAAIERLHAVWRQGALPAPDPAVVAEFDRSRLMARLDELLRELVSG